MSYTPKPTYIVNFTGKAGELGYVRTDDVNEAKKAIAIAGGKVTGTELDKRSMIPTLSKALSSGGLSVLLKRAGSVNNDEALLAQEELRGLFNSVKAAGIGEFDTDLGMEIAKATYKAAEGDVLHIHLPIQDDGNDDAKDDEDESTQAAEDFARSYAHAYALSRAQARSKSR